MAANSHGAAGRRDRCSRRSGSTCEGRRAMPVREAKGRLMVREWFADRDWMTTFSPAEREFMMGLAQFADDAGYLQWDPDTIAGSLYRYEPLASRERKVR